MHLRIGHRSSTAALRRKYPDLEITDQRRNTMAKKKAKKAGKKRKPNAAFMKPMTPSASLAAVVGSSAMPRTEVTKKIWGYIKRNSLQDKKNRRMINADDKLKAVFSGKSQVSMFEMTKLVNKHLK
jgi:chromatin remodeling complex protein RSC6